MSVPVIGLNGRPLMPTTERKARILLKEKKAKVVCRHPFVIGLLHKTGCVTQEGCLGVDTGSRHIGIAATVGNSVVLKAEHTLRPSMEKRSLMEARASMRRNRRYRKVRYRHPKWRYRTKRVYCEAADKKGRHWKKLRTRFQSPRPEGWLPPSLQSKCDHQAGIIRKYLEFLPESITRNLVIEVGRFDMAHMKDPSIRGEMYQKGPMYETENVRAYVLERDRYTCKCCKAKAGSKRKDGTVVKLIAHHILYRSRGATDNPEYMASVCNACHTTKNHQPGGILYQWMIKKKRFRNGLRDATFMNILRKRLFKAFPDAVFTYGNITAADRKQMMLPKTHSNDAAAISLYGKDVQSVSDSCKVTYYRQVRRTKRSLHEATPRKGGKTPNRTASRHRKNVVEYKGFRLWDTVRVGRQKLFVSSFSGSGVYLVDHNGAYICQEGKDYKQWPLSKVVRLHPNGGWITS